MNILHPINNPQNLAYKPPAPAPEDLPACVYFKGQFFVAYYFKQGDRKGFNCSSTSVTSIAISRRTRKELDADPKWSRRLLP